MSISTCHPNAPALSVHLQASSSSRDVNTRAAHLWNFADERGLMIIEADPLAPYTGDPLFVERPAIWADL